MKIEEAYTFDDLMLVPQHSEVKSRKEPDTKTFVGKSEYKIPIISSPMNTVTEYEMAIAMSSIGAGSVIHRYMSIEDEINQWKKVRNERHNIVLQPYMAIGASGDFLERAQELHKEGANKFCIDVANGHSEVCLRAVKDLRKSLGDNISIMAGNVCTGVGVFNLEAAGADVIRVGIGPGSQCSTRLVTGFGIPQLTAIKWCSEAVKEASIVADGGIRCSGDVVKALAMGAHAVMIGGLIAGTDECPGEVIRDEETGQLFKYYHGMASREGREDWFGREVSAYVPEGVSTKVPHRGEAKKIVEELNNSLKVGMSFANALTLQELRQKAKWVKITDNGRKEANPNRRMFK